MNILTLKFASGSQGWVILEISEGVTQSEVYKQILFFLLSFPIMPGWYHRKK